MHTIVRESERLSIGDTYTARYICPIALVLVALLAGCGGGIGNRGIYASAYSVSELPMAETQTISEAWFVDNSGRIIGVVSPDTGTGGFCAWLPGQTDPTLLSIPDEVSYCIITENMIGVRFQRMSNQGRMAYIGDHTTGIVDLLSGVTVALPGLPGTPCAAPNDINDFGVCVGTCYPDSGRGDPALPAMWLADGQVRQLALPPGCGGGEANAINGLGQIVGTVHSEKYPYLGHAVVWNADGSVARVIPWTAEQEQRGSGARGLLISDNGYVVVSDSIGYCFVSLYGSVRYTVWRGIGEDIFAINSRGQVSGFDAEGPVVWNPDGTKIRLPLPSEGALCEAWDIGDDGVVVGTAQTQDPPRTVAVKWTPVR